tara:strand:+ start:2953 stop:3666 length:714 start_codon:yes stop_codon:yes gene_type:complete
MKIYYDFKDPNVGTEIEDLVLPFKTQPIWYKTLPPFLYGFKNAAALIKAGWDDIFNDENGHPNIGFTTIKHCPGFKGLFKYSLVTKFPGETFLETNQNGQFRSTTSTKSMTVLHHDEEQFGKGLAKDWIVIKFNLNLGIKVSEDCTLTSIDPVIWNNQPYKACPGIIELKKNKLFSLNQIVLFPKINAKYTFKPDDIMMAYSFSKAPTKLIKSNFTHEWNRLYNHSRWKLTNNWKRT